MIALKDFNVNAYNWLLVPNGAMTFEVSVENARMVVDLNTCTCICRKWELSGILFMHAVSSIYHLMGVLEKYVDELFHVSTYVNSYGFHIIPIVGHQAWKQSGRVAIKAPRLNIDQSKKRRRHTTKRKKGQEKRTQKKSKEGRVSKKGTIMRCSACRLEGHNKARCPSKQTSEQTETPTATKVTIPSMYVI
ncbi:hypothetical protein LINPERHAP1_LOCUS4737 [Linum perenne]